uniref:Uncharacterized protein n=1 Tax=Picea sitchensis TaxID=3332 RepID=A9NW61_PICSI|nr:unknown [Picea sitchensis]
MQQRSIVLMFHAEMQQLKWSPDLEIKSERFLLVLIRCITDRKQMYSKSYRSQQCCTFMVSSLFLSISLYRIIRLFFQYLYEETDKYSHGRQLGAHVPF